MNLRRTDTAPDDPGALMYAAAQDAVRDVSALARQAATRAHGNRQLADWATTIGVAQDVPTARTHATAALHIAAGNPPLQNLALDVLNRLRGL